jgi:NAD(P)-dependent dehydrogenase (short-subunit alcohol dehydrogenase family)
VSDQPRPAALVTGSSRGIGAETALALARHGYDTVITCRNKAGRAEARAREVRALGVRCLIQVGDLTEQDHVSQLAANVAVWTPALDVLVLNASGGLERDLVAADPTYPWRINRDAQVAMLDALSPLMTRGGVVVFVTSHWAHLYGHVTQIPAYEPIARSKRAGEDALRARQGDLALRGIRLVVVTGDLIEGTITPMLLERSGPGLRAERLSELGALPTAGDMGEAIAGAVMDASLPSGHTIVIGGGLDTVTRAGMAPC